MGYIIFQFHTYNWEFSFQPPIWPTPFLGFSINKGSRGIPTHCNDLRRLRAYEKIHNLTTLLWKVWFFHNIQGKLPGSNIPVNRMLTQRRHRNLQMVTNTNIPPWLVCVKVLKASHPEDQSISTGSRICGHGGLLKWYSSLWSTIHNSPITFPSQANSHDNLN